MEGRSDLLSLHIQLPRPYKHLSFISLGHNSKSSQVETTSSPSFSAHLESNSPTTPARFISISPPKRAFIEYHDHDDPKGSCGSQSKLRSPSFDEARFSGAAPSRLDLLLCEGDALWNRARGNTRLAKKMGRIKA
ncbi:hypothetical protein AKJ16_DCAP14366 [Drosera capensis]